MTNPTRGYRPRPEGLGHKKGHGVSRGLCGKAGVRGLDQGISPGGTTHPGSKREASTSQDEGAEVHGAEYATAKRRVASADFQECWLDSRFSISMYPA